MIVRLMNLERPEFRCEPEWRVHGDLETIYSEEPNPNKIVKTGFLKI